MDICWLDMVPCGNQLSEDCSSWARLDRVIRTTGLVQTESASQQRNTVRTADIANQGAICSLLSKMHRMRQLIQRR